jgi:hypothetical protein
LTETLEQYRARMAAELERANNEDLLREVKAVQKRNGWTFDRSWSHVLATQPAYQRNRPEKVESAAAKERSYAMVEAKAHALIRESGGRLTMSEALVRARTDEPSDPGTPKDPRVAEALGKLKALEDDKSDAGIQRHVKFLSEVKKLLSRDTSMTHSEAINRVIREHPELWPGAKVPARHGDSLPIGGSYLVFAQLATQIDGLPSEVMYFPAGRSTITPTVNGKPKEISVTVTPSTAAALQADLTRLLSGNVRPYVDFDHAGGAAAALPRRFFWKDGEGVMMELDWTGAGKTAIGDRNYSYLSPTFMLSGDDGTINLPSTGAIASLVNNPAFRSIRRIHQ